MKKYKMYKRFCMAIAVFLSHIMCIRVSYLYCTFQWAGKYEGWSAPPDTAFLYAIPFVIGILPCLTLTWIFHKKISGIKST